MTATAFSLSLSDLVLIPNFAEAFGKNNKEAIQQILFENGMDIKEEIEEVVCQHRNLQNQVITCLRFEGNERQDKQWLKSESASWEATLASMDPELRKDVLELGKQSNFTQTIISHISDGKEKAE